MENEIDKAVLTIATGKQIYIQMAINLARSFKLFHKGSDIQFFIATDQKDLIPTDLSDIKVIELQPGQLGHGFSPKLHLDKIAPATHTLFVDSDCLCFGSLDSVFDRFSGNAVSVIGKKLFEGEFFGDIKSVRKQFDLPYLPFFVGGIYYIEKGDISTRVYSAARDLERQYDEIGLIRLRGRPNEEPLMAIGMAMYGQSPIEEDGSIKAEPMFYPSGVSVNVFTGKTLLKNSPSHSSYSTVWGLEEAKPLLVHFHCVHAKRSPYTRECFALKKVCQYGWNPSIARLYAYLKLSLPQKASDAFKDTLRPLYRKLFGTRRIRPSERIVDV